MQRLPFLCVNPDHCSVPEGNATLTGSMTCMSVLHSPRAWPVCRHYTHPEHGLYVGTTLTESMACMSVLHSPQAWPVCRRAWVAAAAGGSRDPRGASSSCGAAPATSPSPPPPRRPRPRSRRTSTCPPSSPCKNQLQHVFLQVSAKINFKMSSFKSLQKSTSTTCPASSPCKNEQVCIL